MDPDVVDLIRCPLAVSRNPADLIAGPMFEQDAIDDEGEKVA